MLEKIAVKCMLSLRLGMYAVHIKVSERLHKGRSPAGFVELSVAHFEHGTCILLLSATEGDSNLGTSCQKETLANSGASG